MTEQESERGLRALDAPLRRAAHGLTGHRAVLAVLVRATAMGCSPRVTQRWCESRLPDEVALLTPAAWARLHAAAREKVAGSVPDGGVATATLLTNVARRWLSALVSPYPVIDPRTGEPHDLRAVKVNGARQVVAVVGREMLSQIARPGQGHAAMDTALVSAARVGVRLGIRRVTAYGHIKTAIQLGWLRPVKAMKQGLGTRVRLGRPRTDADRALTWALSDTVDALVDAVMRDEPYGLDVAWLLAADHPTWAYSPERAKGQRLPSHPERGTWLVGLADALSSESGLRVDPVETFGLGKSLVSAHRRLVWEHDLPSDPMHLRDRLREIGEANGAVERARDAEAARVAAAQARRDEVEAARARKRAAVRFVSGALDRVENETAVRVPIGPDPAWARALRDAMSDLDPALTVPARKELTRVLGRGGLDPETASGLAEKIVAQPAAAA